MQIRSRSLALSNLAVLIAAAFPIWILAPMVSCGGSGSGSAPAIPGLSVGGTYDTTVTLLSAGNTCGNVTVQNNPTVVDHTPGSASLSLTHAGNVYPGSVDRTGHFSTPARVVGGNNNIAITGQFSANGFDATVQVQQLSPSCGYQVHWAGSKSGSPNTFP
jgi:hypothetical protein